jgi:hypothetical protein
MSIANKISKSRSSVNIDKILERSGSATKIVKDWIGIVALIPGAITYLGIKTTVIPSLPLIDLPSLLLFLLSVAVVLPILMNITQKEPTSFESFKTRSDTFNYFKDRMNGANGRKAASRIAVTYFVDVSPAEENNEKEYFELQTGLVLASKLEVRRILLIKNESDYRKMRQQLIDLGKSKLFELGIYILAEDEGVTTIGNFRKHLNFNFMIIDDNEFCFNNGNRYADYSTSTIMHKKLAEEMNKHIIYLWNNSHKVKLSGGENIEASILLEIENECKAKKILPQDYVYTLV